MLKAKRKRSREEQASMDVDVTHPPVTLSEDMNCSPQSPRPTTKRACADLATAEESHKELPNDDKIN